jgi:hypothetical protein
MHRKVSRRLLLATTIGIVSLQLGCNGGDGGGSTMPTPVPVRTVIAQGNFKVSDVLGSKPIPHAGGWLMGPCAALEFISFSTGQTGTLDVIVEWGNVNNDIDIAVIRGTFPEACNCNLHERSNTCESNMVGSSWGSDKPERLSISNLSSGNFILFISNLGQFVDSGTYEIGLTS